MRHFWHMVEIPLKKSWNFLGALLKLSFQYHWSTLEISLQLLHNKLETYPWNIHETPIQLFIQPWKSHKTSLRKVDAGGKMGKRKEWRKQWPLPSLTVLSIQNWSSVVPIGSHYWKCSCQNDIAQDKGELNTHNIDYMDR